MEINISDLLDALPEVNVDIRPHTTASESRIKELTMQKIQAIGKYKRKRRGAGFAFKLLIAAAIITALAVPAMAASGVQFTDWIDGLFSPRTYEENFDNNLLVGSESKKWEVSGWVLEISAENTTNTGLTFICRELGNPDKSGTLTTDQSYWLEKWDGSAYVPMGGTADSGKVQSIDDSATERWNIDWTDAYGELTSGSYRIGKTFTYTATNGSQEQLSYYAKFRIFTQEMAPLLERQEQGYAELLNREIYHLSWTNYSLNKDDYAHRWVGEVWKYGKDYLELTSYYNEDGSLKSHRGYLLRDGIGYELFWADGNVNAQVTEWHNADWVEPGTFELWHSSMDLHPAILGEAWEDDNTLYFIEYSDWKNENMLSASEIESLNESSPYWNHDYTELSYTFDDSGRICYMQYAQKNSLDPAASDTVIRMELEVHDTPQENIRAMIESQNLGSIPAFSWAEEQVQYADSALDRDFINTSIETMDSVQTVIDRARQEADPKENPLYRDGYDYNEAVVFLDEAAGMWKVVFSHSQDDDFVFIVYLNIDGITQMMVHP